MLWFRILTGLCTVGPLLLLVALQIRLPAPGLRGVPFAVPIIAAVVNGQLYASSVDVVIVAPSQIVVGIIAVVWLLKLKEQQFTHSD